MKKTPLRRISKKRSKQNNEYLKKSREYLAENPTCQICCTDAATQIHHSFGRSGVRLLWKEYWVATCQSCHSSVHANPKASMKAGWILHRTDNL